MCMKRSKFVSPAAPCTFDNCPVISSSGVFYPNLSLTKLHSIHTFLYQSYRGHMVEMHAGCATVSRLKQRQRASVESCQLRDAVVKAATKRKENLIHSFN